MAYIVTKLCLGNKDTANALETAKRAGMWVVGMEPGGDRLEDCGLLDERVVLVAGSEGGGLRPRVRKACDARCGIPMRGRVASLNVATAAAILVFHTAGRHDVEGPDHPHADRPT